MADREIRDVDHLLHFTVALGLDLAVLEGHEAAERVFVGAQFFADVPHRLAALRRRHAAPGSAAATADAMHVLVVGGRGAAHLRQALAGRRVDRVDQRPGIERCSSRGCRTRCRR